MKLGVGTEKNFFDLIFLRIRDDSTALQQSDNIAIRTPEQNIVSGFNSRFTLFKKLTWETEGAFSLYTTNMRAPHIKDVEENSILKSMNNFLLINQSSEYYSAIRSSLQYKALLWSLKLEYKRIEPKYRSMGAYFFNNDLENLLLSPSFTLFQRKLSASSGIGLQKDNLRSTKRATTLRTIGNINVSFNPSYKFGVDLNYNNYSMNQRAARFLLNDTTKIRQTTLNFSVIPRLLFVDEDYSHMVMLLYNMATFDDKNKFTSEFTRFNSQMAQLNYILGLVPSQWSFTFGLTFTSVVNVFSDITGLGGTVGLSKSLLQNKLLLSWTNSLMSFKTQQERGWTINSIFAGNYQVNNHHSLRLNLYFIGNYYPSGSIIPSFNELKGDISYVYTF